MSEDSNSYDVAIIGSGIAGASLAYELSTYKLSVLVLEMEAYPAYHTTGRSAAFYMEAYGNDCVRSITKASRDFYNKPPQDFCETPLLKPFGALFVGSEAQKNKIKQRHQHLSQHIADCQLVDHSFIAEKIPRIRPIIQHGFWEPQSMEIDVGALMNGYTRLARKNGARSVFNQQVKQLSFRNNQWLINNTYKANIVVNAAGAWADNIALLAGTKTLGLEPKKRNICVARVEKKFGEVKQWPLCVDIDEQFYFKPEGDNLLITPADEIPSEPHDAQANELDIALGIDRVQQVIDIEFSHVLRKWAGLRTFSSDRSPIVGFDPEMKNFFWLAGQGGYGIQMGPALAKLACNDLQHKESTIPGLTKKDVSPERFH